MEYDQSHREQIDYNDQSDQEEQIIQTQKKVKKGTDIDQIKQLLHKSVPRDAIQIEERLSNVKFFKRIKEEIPPEFMKQIFEELEYEFVPMLKPVYRQGESSRKFYIILEGSAVVLKSSDRVVGSQKVGEDEVEEEVQEKEERKISEETDPITYIIGSYPTYTHIKTLKAGSSFGEVALKLELTRTATVVAATDLHLLWIPAASYKRLLNPYFSMMLDKKIAMFNNNPLFNQIPTEQIMGVILELHYKSYLAGQEIYSENSKPTHMYFIMLGEVQLSKMIPGHKLIALASYAENQIFGATEILNKTLRYTNAVAVSPKVAVYSVSKNKFFDNLGSYRVFETMKRQAQMVRDSQIERYEKIKEDLTGEHDDVYANMNQNPTNKVMNFILNNRIIRHHSISQIRMFQQLADDEQDTAIRQVKDRNSLQKVYCNSLQGFLEKIISEPSRQQYNGDSIRGSTNLTLENQIDPTSQYHNRQKNTIKPVISQISSLPRIERDNLVMRLLRQQASRSKNPKVEHRKINQAFDFATAKIVSPPKKKVQLAVSGIDNDVKLLKVLKIPKMFSNQK